MWFRICSWLLNNMGFNCTDPLLYGFFSINTVLYDERRRKARLCGDLATETSESPGRIPETQIETILQLPSRTFFNVLPPQLCSCQCYFPLTAINTLPPKIYVSNYLPSIWPTSIQLKGVKTNVCQTGVTNCILATASHPSP